MVNSNRGKFPKNRRKFENQKMPKFHQLHIITGTAKCKYGMLSFSILFYRFLTGGKCKPIRKEFNKYFYIGY